MMPRIASEIEQTLFSMGVVGIVTFRCHRNLTAGVFVNGEFFGLWCVCKKVFLK